MNIVIEFKNIHPWHPGSNQHFVKVPVSQNAHSCRGDKFIKDNREKSSRWSEQGWLISIGNLKWNKNCESEKARQRDISTLSLISSLPIIDYTVYILWYLLDVSFKQELLCDHFTRLKNVARYSRAKYEPEPVPEPCNKCMYCTYIILYFCSRSLNRLSLIKWCHVP